MSYNRGETALQEKTLAPAIAELADLTERAKRASKTTAELVQEYKFIVTWYAMRPHSRLRPDPILDESEHAGQSP